MGKIIVLDLFAGTQSVRKALEQMPIEFEYIGIDIESPEAKNLIIDLSSEFAKEMVLDRLEGKIPDIVWASPICNTFSQACAYKDGNLYYEKEGPDSLKVRTKMDDPNNRKYKDTSRLPLYQEKARKGLLMHNNCKKIIEHFKVPFAIENPAGAMSRLLYKDYVRNRCDYCAYGFTYKKPTAIYSNKEILLKRCTCVGIHKDSMSGVAKRHTIKKYNSRAVVPPHLIVEVFEQLLNKENKNEI